LKKGYLAEYALNKLLIKLFAAVNIFGFCSSNSGQETGCFGETRVILSEDCARGGECGPEVKFFNLTS